MDLLGFEFLVDGLFVALTQPQLLPLTCGLLGDWGSGKSSVLGLLREELEGERSDDDSESKYLCVTFSPWQHEGYDDIRTALIGAVLDALAERSRDPQLQEKVSFLSRCARGFARWGRRAARGALVVAPAAVPLAIQAAQPGFDPAATEAIKTMTGAAAGAASEALRDPKEPGSDTATDETPPIATAAQFRAELADLLEAVPGLEALVVLIDDMDRCLPDTVVDTFEAVRLFLGSHKTAYVIAANEDIVQAAVDARYRELVIDGTGLGARYLEKMLQIRLRIPALNGLEADTYMNLLLAELHLESHQFDRALEHVRERRAAGELDVAFNPGVCFELFGEHTPAGLIEDLTWAATVSPVLSGGLRGNPRELKRFLNSLMLRHASAERRGVFLQRPVLAKLMVLEEHHPEDFRQLFAWQSLTPGPIPELVAAENAVLGAANPQVAETPSTLSDLDDPGDGGPDTATIDPGHPPLADSPGAADIAADGADQTGNDGGRDDQGQSAQIEQSVVEWTSKGHIKDWLALTPPLGGVDLRPYFAYARDRLAPSTGIASLGADLQLLLTRLQIDSRPVRDQAGRQVAKLPPGERHRLVQALLDALAAHPSGPAFRAALDLLEHNDDTLEPVITALMGLPTSAVPPAQLAHAVARLRGKGEQADAVLARWRTSDIPTLASAVSQLLDASERGARRGRPR